MKVVLVSGHYNLLHAGHIDLFEFAKAQGDVLVVGINGDASNIVKNGEHAVPAKQRERVLRACRYVDDVVVFEETTPNALILLVRPDVYIRGPDYKGQELPEQPALDEVGTLVVIQDVLKINHSSQLKKLI